MAKENVRFRPSAPLSLRSLRGGCLNRRAATPGDPHQASRPAFSGFADAARAARRGVVARRDFPRLVVRRHVCRLRPRREFGGQSHPRSPRRRGQQPRFVETLARRGYRFVAPVEAIAAEADQSPASESTSPSQSISETEARTGNGILASLEELPETSPAVVQTLFFCSS